MAINLRKQRILDHLKQSADGVQYAPKKTTRSTSSPAPVVIPEVASSPAPVFTMSRKQKVMNHVKTSSSEFGDFTLETPDRRKRQIHAHLKKSLGV